jgi:serine/threonine-protein kinase HipA
MTIMQELGFDVPNCWLANFIPERDSPIERAFVIKRFDRDNDGNPIHQEQLDAAMNATCKYGETDPNTEHSYISYERVYHFLKQHLVANPVLEDEFYKRVIAAYLLGNCDLHLRNFAIIYDDCGHMRLAPVYDYVAVSAYPFIMEPSMALPLRQFEEGNQNACPGFAQHGVYTGRDFIDFGCAIGLSEVTATHYIDDLFSHVPQIIEQYRCSLLPDHQIQSIEQWVNTVAYHFIEYR